MKNNIKKLLLVITLIIGSVGSVLAQPQPPIGDANPNLLPGAQTLSCPVGDGYYVLIAMALAYGIYRVWQMRKVDEIA